MYLGGGNGNQLPTSIHTSMRGPSFHEWLRNRSDEAPAAESLATLIAGAGAAGISHDHLRRVVSLRPEVLTDLLRALEVSGQVTVVKVNGQRVYRATT
jgi:hypothetical protein